MTTNYKYLHLLKRLWDSTHEVSPRGEKTHEIIGLVTEIDMDSPIITVPQRELDYQFMAEEARWILSGERRLSHILRKNLLKYSDDGVTMRGAYGPPFLQQVEHVVDLLRGAPNTRQAVMTLWERSPRSSRDIPCTVGLQWLFRNEKLHCNVFMRSSDIYLGFPYDIFTFSMMTLYLIKSIKIPIPLGTLRLFAGSAHLYARHRVMAKFLYENGTCGENLAIDTHGIINPDDLLSRLNAVSHASDDHLQHLKDLVCVCP